jgi:hypothetical protein
MAQRYAEPPFWKNRYPPRVSGDDRLPKRILRSLPVVVAIASVLASYAYFGGGGKFDFRRLGTWEESNYASLAEGFSRGHLYILIEPEPQLVALPYPYDFKARHGFNYRWDASYLNGKYYLYSSPLPVLLVYMPFRLLRGAYPPDALVAVIFSAWAFLAAVAFARRALALSGRRQQIPFALWVLFIGLGNVVAFGLTTVHMYEIAVMTGMAMTATWAFALLRFNESPTPGRAVWVNVWLALAIAARPNLGVLIIITAIVILRKRRPSVKAILAIIAPLAIVAAAMLWYNAARFGNPLEFGVRYQLTHVDMENRKVCSLCTFPELARFGNNVMHYVFWPVHLRSTFPFVDAQPARLDPAVSWPTPGGVTEQIVGIAPLAPLMMLGTCFGILLVLGLARDPSDAGLRTAIQVTAGAWMILFGLSSCWWVVARYSLDFMMLMSASAVVCIEAGLTSLRAVGVRILPLRVAVAALACYSILMGLLLGYCGPGDAFQRANPATFRMISGWFK